MTAKHRMVLCVLSTILATGGFAASGGWRPAAKLLHEWFGSVLLIFLFLFVALMFITIRGKLTQSMWAIVISALLTYPAATLSYVFYFALFEPKRFMNALTHIPALDVVFGLLLVAPTISFAWLFGAFAGILFVALGRVSLPGQGAASP